jgi:hypothetical protein
MPSAGQPRRARNSPSPRISLGEPVNPWTNRQPGLEAWPGKKNGSAPGIISVIAKSL